MREELRIRQHAGISFPFDFHTAGNTPDEIEFGAAAHVDQLGAGLLFQQRLGFGRQQRAFVGKAFFTRPGARRFKNFVDSGHEATSKMGLKAKFYSKAGRQ